jgi:hypothetical protein
MRLRTAEVDEFVVRACKLENSAFWQWQNRLPIRANQEAIAAGNWLAYDGLRAEDLDSFCLNLRLLIQDRDGLSIRKISEVVAAWPAEYEEQKAQVRAAIATLNQRMDGPCFVSLHGTGTTNREFFNTLFYGGLVHSDPAKRAAYARLVNAGLFSNIVFSVFWGILCDFRNCIQTMAHHIATGVRRAREDERGS